VLKLDGSTTINKRQKLVKLFNDPAERQFVFLLSSKAGGCGLNLIGGNRLVLFDPDWCAAAPTRCAARAMLLASDRLHWSRLWRSAQAKVLRARGSAHVHVKSAPHQACTGPGHACARASDKVQARARA